MLAIAEGSLKAPVNLWFLYIHFLYNHSNPQQHLESNPRPERCLLCTQSGKSGEERGGKRETVGSASYSVSSSASVGVL